MPQQAGDQVTIDFKGMLNGEVFEGGVASDFKMVLGKGSMIAGFEDGLFFKPSIFFSPNFFANSSSNFGDWGAATSFISTSNTTSLPRSR
jgi:hypothetical protein